MTFIFNRFFRPQFVEDIRVEFALGIRNAEFERRALALEVKEKSDRVESLASEIEMLLGVVTELATLVQVSFEKNIERALVEDKCNLLASGLNTRVIAEKSKNTE